MGQSQAAAGTTGMDRLPWLPDEPAQRAKHRRSDLLAGGAGAVLLIAAASYWLGVNNGSLAVAPPTVRSVTTTVPLPPAETAAPPEVKIERVVEVEPMAAPPMPVIETPHPVSRPLLKSAPTVQPTDEVKDATQSAAPADAIEPWPVRAVDGAAGRLVRVGAFATARQAKKGWWAIVRMNPALERLPALVVPVRSLRNGRTYYRLQMGTTSQAHSEVLCQRMRMIAQGCVVIGVAAAARDAS